MEALKVDLDAKSRAATAGWDAAANAESEAEAAEARGLQAGIKRGRAEAERKARLCCDSLRPMKLIISARTSRWVSLARVLSDAPLLPSHIRKRMTCFPLFLFGGGSALIPFHRCSAPSNLFVLELLVFRPTNVNASVSGFVLRCQVRGLQEELSKATASSAAATAAASASAFATAAAERSEAAPSPPPGGLDIKTETTVLGEVATAAPAIAPTKELGNRSGSVEAWVEEGSGSGQSPAQRKALELEGVERELENVREREQDSKGEAERLAEELNRARWV